MKNRKLPEIKQGCSYQ